MRVLVHMVGDVHQPLHVAYGYYDVTDLVHPKLITNPALAVGKPNDRGGNPLFTPKPSNFMPCGIRSLLKELRRRPIHICWLT